MLLKVAKLCIEILGHLAKVLSSSSKLLYALGVVLGDLVDLFDLLNNTTNTLLYLMEALYHIACSTHGIVHLCYRIINTLLSTLRRLCKLLDLLSVCANAS